MQLQRRIAPFATGLADQHIKRGALVCDLIERWIGRYEANGSKSLLRVKDAAEETTRKMSVARKKQD